MALRRNNCPILPEEDEENYVNDMFETQQAKRQAYPTGQENFDVYRGDIPLVNDMDDRK